MFDARDHVRGDGFVVGGEAFDGVTGLVEAVAESADGGLFTAEACVVDVISVADAVELIDAFFHLCHGFEFIAIGVFSGGEAEVGVGFFVKHHTEAGGVFEEGIPFFDGEDVILGELCFEVIDAELI